MPHPRSFARLVLLFALLLAPTLVRAESALAEKLTPLIEAHKGQVAVVVKHLQTGEEFRYRDAEPMPTASLIKLAVMVEAYRQAEEGKLDLNEPVRLKEEDKVPGSGILTKHFSPGMRISLRDAIRLMIAYSDNTATNLVLDHIGLPATAQRMESLGLPNTKIHAKVFRGDTSIFPERSKQFGLGSTTAAEMVRLLEMLHQRTLVSETACATMLEHLRACEDKTCLPRFLPTGTKVAHKTGAVTAVRTAAGIIDSPQGPIAVCVLTRDNQDKRWIDDNAGNRLCADIAKAAYDYFNPAASASDTESTELAVGAQGAMVEALQRTLNQRLTPSPDLSVDGEFGPATQSALIAFQKAHELGATGIVTAEVWKALGPLALTAEPVPEPDVVNSEVLEKLPPDPLSGSPFVTCKAWAIGNARTGELLWGTNETDQLDFASTTKVMTAWLVLQEAKKDPALLDETVTFSARADRTGGSTSDVRAGEKLPVRELLYGLLLPSGNDAAIALAEHVGHRFEPPNGKPDAEPLARFVAEMNRTAAALGMDDTHYENPHGLPAKRHQSTARDLLKLAATVCGDAEFLRYVGTRQHGCCLEGPGGYQRNVVWKNTNKLLETDGYLGVKTGTTTAAGACLISLGERDAERLIVVVLGSTSTDARYTDTRNLFRWAWLARGHKP